MRVERFLRPFAPGVVRDLHEVGGQRVAALQPVGREIAREPVAIEIVAEGSPATAFHSASSPRPIAFDVRCSRQV